MELKMAGRPKGSKTRYSTTLQRQMLNSDSPTPLEYLVSVYTDEDSPLNVRLDAAKAAAPYVHPRLSAVEVSSDKHPDDCRLIPTWKLIAAINGESEGDSCAPSSDSRLQAGNSGDQPINPAGNTSISTGDFTTCPSITTSHQISLPPSRYSRCKIMPGSSLPRSM